MANDSRFFPAAFHGHPDALAELLHVRVAGTGEHGEELLSAAAQHGVALAQHRSCRVGDGAEHLVPRLVAERVVEHLEVVDVEQQHAEGLVVPHRAREVLSEPFEPEAAVVEAGQRIECRHLLESFVAERVVDGHGQVRNQLVDQPDRVLLQRTAGGDHGHAHGDAAHLQREGQHPPRPELDQAGIEVHVVGDVDDVHLEVAEGVLHRCRVAERAELVGGVDRDAALLGGADRVVLVEATAEVRLHAYHPGAEQTQARSDHPAGERVVDHPHDQTGTEGCEEEPERQNQSGRNAHQHHEEGEGRSDEQAEARHPHHEVPEDPGGEPWQHAPAGAARLGVLRERRRLFAHGLPVGRRGQPMSIARGGPCARA